MNSMIVAMVLCMAGVGLAFGANKPEFAAHRGENSVAPENTLSSFNLAWERHDDAIELDIHLTSDGQVIVCHDYDTKRTTNADLKIKESTLEQLRQLDAGSYKDPKYKGEKLPVLSEVLATIPPGKRCFTEIKVGPEIVPALKQVMDSSGKTAEQLVIISFHADALAEAKKQLPAHQCYYLTSPKQDKKTKKWSPTIDELIATAKEIHADGLDVNYKAGMNEAAVKKIKAAGLKCYIWTCDDPAIGRKFADWGVDGITTNKAMWMKEQVLAE
jgi:glycerophosphoryl diester phosphodiesterase